MTRPVKGASKDPKSPQDQRDIISGLRREGRRADALLRQSGLVLTQGGEPTFVPEETSSPEWNLEALGAEKLSRAWDLARELARALMPGALILRSNGKHYPGEPIPRWKLTLLRNPGNKPLWQDQDRLLQGSPAKGRPVTPRKFLSCLASELGLPSNIHPAYEDVEAAMRHAAACGSHPPLPRYSRKKRGFVQPRWSREERAKWQQMHRASGWVLPMGRDEAAWISGHWSFPEGELRLLPGSSAIGLRLPLGMLPPEALRSAITAEVRDGGLLVFLPPLPDAESFAELLSAVERTALRLSSPPLSIEGYPPPDAPGWESLSLIPDPGVIEVNLPPADDWESLEKTVSALYEAAAHCGLQGTRRLPSGEIVPTGGGAHLVLGGASLEENPFLLNPSLLPGFLRFIQHHPSLSYLFSGRFTGPSSQAPRIDESFFEVPYELEIALRAIEGMAAPADAAAIDSILRNLLLDLHGNTHKAEVSVDKFFNPFIPNGRLGLVEFRAIEMSPDAPTFLSIHALWRALAASLATRPFREPVRDWQGALHDRFLLPSFLERDLQEVLTYLEQDGFSFETSWFRTHLHFRFPFLAEESLGDGHWTLRRAVEPWPLLGEQPTPSGGLVRCVDSSTERLEIRLLGLPEETEVRINGHLLPLETHPGGGRFGGVRFRTAWLPTCLHPQVAPHTPLEISFLEHPGKQLGVWHYLSLPLEADGKTRRVIPAKETRHPKLNTDQRPASRRTLDLRAAASIT